MGRARRPLARARRDVYVYFDNDNKAHAPGDARRLLDRVDPRLLAIAG